MSTGNQLPNRTAGGQSIIDGHGRVALLVQCAKDVRITAADKRYSDCGKLCRYIVIPPAQEKQPTKFLLPLQNRASFYLVRPRINKMRYRSITPLGYFIPNSLQHPGKEKVFSPPNNHSDCIRAAFDQIPRAVIRDIGATLYFFQDPLSYLFTYVRVGIQHSGHGTNAYTAVFRNVFNRHII